MMSWDQITAPGDNKIDQDIMEPKTAIASEDPILATAKNEVIKALQQIGSEIILPPVLQKLIDGEPAAKSTPADIHRTARSLAKAQKMKQKATDVIEQLEDEWLKFTKAMKEQFLTKKDEYNESHAAWTTALQSAQREEMEALAQLAALSRENASNQTNKPGQGSDTSDSKVVIGMPEFKPPPAPSATEQAVPQDLIQTRTSPPDTIPAEETTMECQPEKQPRRTSRTCNPKEPKPKKPKADNQQNKLQFPGRERSRSNNSNRCQPLSEDAEGEEGCPKQG